MTSKFQDIDRTRPSSSVHTFRMEDVQFQNGLLATSNLNDALDQSTSASHSLSKETWSELKPTIRELYLDQGQTLKQLAKHIEDHHGLKPTRKQLLYRISAWGFEKNVKKNERKAIIERLGPELGSSEFEAQTLRGRKLDAAKLNRWMQLEKANFEQSSVGIEESSFPPADVIPVESSFKTANKDSEISSSIQTPGNEKQNEVDPPFEESQNASVSRYNGDPFDWNTLDFIGSPGLTKLIGALAIAECDIPFLELDPNKVGAGDVSGMDLMDLCDSHNSAERENFLSGKQSWSSRLSTSIKTSQTSGSFESSLHFGLQFGLQFELYPFPSSFSSRKLPNLHTMFFLRNSHKSKLSESECKNKLRKLKQMDPTEMIHLVEAIGARAEEIFQQGRYNIAETWFQRVVRLKKLMKWYKPQQTLWACLQVTHCVLLQGRYQKALQIQQNLHSTITQVFCADHEVVIEFMRIHSESLLDLGFATEAEAICRQVLQICLSTFGMKHSWTFIALETLGTTLSGLRRFGEAQQLLEASLHFRLRSTKSTEFGIAKSHDILWNVNLLSGCLRTSGRFNESRNVLDFAHNSIASATKTRDWFSFRYHYERASIYKLQKRFENSEEIFRGLLKYHRKHMSVPTSISSMFDLAMILEDTGRQHEAAYWLKKQYFLCVKAYGVTNSFTIDSCVNVRTCYAYQGRYEKAKLFLEEVIKTLGSGTEELESRTLFIFKINSWMEELEQMSNFSQGESVDSEKDSGEDSDEDFDYEDMEDIPDPLDY